MGHKLAITSINSRYSVQLSFGEPQEREQLSTVTAQIIKSKNKIHKLLGYKYFITIEIFRGREMLGARYELKI